LYGALYGSDFEARTWTSEDYINYRDFNRIERNIVLMQDIIEEITSRPTLETEVTDRTNYSLEFKDSLNRIERNILALKNAFYEPLGWETPKTTWASLDAFSYVDANRLENNLANMKIMSERIIAEFEYCGALYCGQVFNLGGI
jgi:hypothetical protein